MNAHSDLMARARRALESTAAVALALAPLAMHPASAATLGTGDLIVDKTGVYFYNSSGFFVNSGDIDRPVGVGQVAGNADGSTKLFGSASASSDQFLQHNCGFTDYCGRDRGVAMQWSGKLARPAEVGDRLAISVDFTITVPDAGGEWSFGAQLADYNLGNESSVSSSRDWGIVNSGAGNYRVHGTVLTDPLYEVALDTPIYWRAFVTGEAFSFSGSSFGGVSITVPDHSIDIAHVDISYAGVPSGLSVSAVPEPATWGMLALGLGLLAARARRRG